MTSVLNGVYCICLFYLELVSTNCFSNFQDQFEFDPVLQSICNLPIIICGFFKILFSDLLSVSRKVLSRAMLERNSTYRSSSVGSVWLFKQLFAYLTVIFVLSLFP